MAERALDDVVRAYQLPQNSPGQLYLSQYGFSNQKPIMVTPGFGASGAGQLPPLLSGSGHFTETVTYYCEQSSVEQALASSF
jgi:hypothetical protein